MDTLCKPNPLSSHSTDNTTPVILGDEETHDSELPVVAETPVVDDDFLHVDKKPCLARDEKPGLEE